VLNVCSNWRHRIETSDFWIEVLIRLIPPPLPLPIVPLEHSWLSAHHTHRTHQIYEPHAMSRQRPCPTDLTCFFFSKCLSQAGLRKLITFPDFGCIHWRLDSITKSHSSDRAHRVDGIDVTVRNRSKFTPYALVRFTRQLICAIQFVISIVVLPFGTFVSTCVAHRYSCPFHASTSLLKNLLDVRK